MTSNANGSGGKASSVLAEAQSKTADLRAMAELAEAEAAEAEARLAAASARTRAIRLRRQADLADNIGHQEAQPEKSPMVSQQSQKPLWHNKTPTRNPKLQSRSVLGTGLRFDVHDGRLVQRASPSSLW